VSALALTHAFLKDGFWVDNTPPGLLMCAIFQDSLGHFLALSATLPPPYQGKDIYVSPPAHSHFSNG